MPALADIFVRHFYPLCTGIITACMLLTAHIAISKSIIRDKNPLYLVIMFKLHDFSIFRRGYAASAFKYFHKVLFIVISEFLTDFINS